MSPALIVQEDVMAQKPLEQDVIDSTADAFIACGRNTAATARLLGIGRSTVQNRLRHAGLWGKSAGETDSRPVATGAEEPTHEPFGHRVFVGSGKVWILTAAQDETSVDESFLQNLEAYAAHRDAHLWIGGFTYQKGLFEDHSVRSGAYVQRVVQYMHPFDEYIAGGKVLWLGSANILPTAVTPTTGFGVFGGDASVLLPHARIQLESVPRLPNKAPKVVATTGVVTVPNYISKTAGKKAEFHHTIGALIVEMDDDGEVFIRQLVANEDGSFQDLDVFVSNGVVSTGHTVEAIVHGDIHYPNVDPNVFTAVWGDGGMVDTLQPRFQIFHDTIDFTTRNHHRREGSHFLAEMRAAGSETVNDEIVGAAQFLSATRRPWCVSVVVESNHDTALTRWLRDMSVPGKDHVNAGYWCKLNSIWFEHINNRSSVNMVALALTGTGHDLKGIHFVPERGSYQVLDIEVGQHGDRGANGARGSVVGLAKVAPKVVAGHVHSPAIRDGAYFVGLYGTLDQGYNVGFTGWANAGGIIYPSAKRTLVFFSGPRWRA
jgi:hypothetical protein